MIIFITKLHLLTSRCSLSLLSVFSFVFLPMFQGLEAPAEGHMRGKIDVENLLPKYVILLDKLTTGKDIIADRWICDFSLYQNQIKLYMILESTGCLIAMYFLNQGSNTLKIPACHRVW